MLKCPRGGEKSCTQLRKCERSHLNQELSGKDLGAKFNQAGGTQSSIVLSTTQSRETVPNPERI